MKNNLPKTATSPNTLDATGRSAPATLEPGQWDALADLARQQAPAPGLALNVLTRPAVGEVPQHL